MRIHTLLIGKSAEPALERASTSCIERDPAIEELLNTITLQFGPKVLLAAKVRMQPGLTIDEAVRAPQRAGSGESSTHHPEVGWCFVEPDVTD